MLKFLRTAVAIVIGLVLVSVFAFLLSRSASMNFDIHVSGLKESGVSGLNTICTVSLTGEIFDATDFVDNLHDLEKDNSVKGVIIKVNSPGGAVTPSQDLYHYVKSFKKPIYAVIETLGASGAYYMSSGANMIYARPSSIVGSIGVIAVSQQYSSLLDKIGIESVVFKTGKYKDTGSPLRKANDDDKAYMQGLVDELYNQFIKDVSTSRKISEPALREYADGRVFTGSRAQQFKLVDKIGYVEDAFEDMKQKVGDSKLELSDCDVQDSWISYMRTSAKTYMMRNMIGSGVYYMMPNGF